VANKTVTISHLATATASTTDTAAYVETVTFDPSVSVQGTTAIAATSTDIKCTAMVINRAQTTLEGVALRGIRFAPVPGSQE